MNCSSEPATPAHILECLGLTKQDLADDPLLVLDFMKVYDVMDLEQKEDLRRIASELELCVSEKLTVLDFMDLIKNCDRYKNDPDSVHELANLIIEERKYDESQQLELEKNKRKV
ncbi:hypothetical protein TNCV_1796531 [Trichonephila clavipes]|nr:hypothetical protein TNCV_1796531 [Trichonephila clavipes]